MPPTDGAVLPSPTAPLQSLPADLPFPALLQWLYAARYRGAVTLHFDNGVPQVVEFPQPQRVRLI